MGVQFNGRQICTICGEHYYMKSIISSPDEICDKCWKDGAEELFRELYLKYKRIKRPSFWKRFSMPRIEQLAYTRYISEVERRLDKIKVNRQRNSVLGDIKIRHRIESKAW